MATEQLDGIAEPSVRTDQVRVKAIRLKVSFSGVRRADWKQFCADLFDAGHDLRRAMNRAMTQMWAARLLDAIPTQTRADGTTRPMPRDTYVCALFSGTQGQTAVYAPKRPSIHLASNVLGAGALKVSQRLSADWRDLMRGTKSLATFSRVRLGIKADSILVTPDGRLALTLWNTKTKRGRVVVRAWARGRGNVALWERVRAGAIEHGAASLEWHERQGWLLLLAVKIPVTPAIRRTEAIGVVTVDAPRGDVQVRLYETTEKQAGYVRHFPVPRDFWRAFRRVLDERRARGRGGRREYGLRTGRGIGRKVRPVEKMSDRYECLVDDACKRLGVAVAEYARVTGVAGVALAPPAPIPRDFFAATDSLVERDRKWLRKRFLAGNAARLGAAIRDACASRGLPLVDLPKLQPVGGSDQTPESQP